MEIYGFVEDQSGKPLVGASVQVQGTAIGDITDGTGGYYLNDTRITDSDSLSISFVGYVPALVAVVDVVDANANGEDPVTTLELAPAGVLPNVVVTAKKPSMAWLFAIVGIIVGYEIFKK